MKKVELNTWSMENEHKERGSYSIVSKVTGLITYSSLRQPRKEKVIASDLRGPGSNPHQYKSGSRTASVAGFQSMNLATTDEMDVTLVEATDSMKPYKKQCMTCTLRPLYSACTVNHHPK